MHAETRDLLMECLEWIGMTNLSPDEEAKACELQERISNHILQQLASPAPARSAEPPVNHYERVIDLRLQTEMAEREKRLAQQVLQSVMRSGDQEQQLYAVRRHTLAYEEWQKAERALQDAEAGYYRSLTRQEVPRCSAA